MGLTGVPSPNSDFGNGSNRVVPESELLSPDRNKLQLCLDSFEFNLVGKALYELAGARDNELPAGKIAAELLQGSVAKLLSILKRRRDTLPLPTTLVTLSGQLELLMQFCDTTWEDEARAAGVQHHVKLLVTLTQYVARWTVRDCGWRTLPVEKGRNIYQDTLNNTLHRVFEYWVAALTKPKDPSDQSPSKDAAAYATWFWTCLDQDILGPLPDLIAKFDPQVLNRFLEAIKSEIIATGAHSSDHVHTATIFLAAFVHPRRVDSIPEPVVDICAELFGGIMDLIDQSLGSDEPLAKRRLHCLWLFLRAFGLNVPEENHDSIREQFQEVLSRLRARIFRWKNGDAKVFCQHLHNHMYYTDFYLAATGTLTSYFDRHNLRNPFHPDRPSLIHKGPEIELVGLHTGLQAVRIRLPQSRCQLDVEMSDTQQLFRVKLVNGDWSPLCNCRFVLPFNDRQKGGQLRFLIFDGVELFNELDVDREESDFLILVRPLGLVIANNEDDIASVAAGSATLIDAENGALEPFREFVHTRHDMQIQAVSLPVKVCSKKSPPNE